MTRHAQPAQPAKSPRPPVNGLDGDLSNGDGRTVLLTAADVAERWQVPSAQVYRLTREGKLPVVRLGRYCRYRLEAVEAFEVGGGTDE
jgi:excisionase family DNA binding protein